MSNFEIKIEERLSCIEDMLNIENNKKSHQIFNNNRRSKVNPNYNNYWKIDRDFHANKKQNSYMNDNRRYNKDKNLDNKWHYNNRSNNYRNFNRNPNYRYFNSFQNFAPNFVNPNMYLSPVQESQHYMPLVHQNSQYSSQPLINGSHQRNDFLGQYQIFPNQRQ